MGVERICEGGEGGEGGSIKGVRVGVKQVCVGVERVHAGVECVCAGVEGGGIEGTREWANMGWESESETHESYIVYIPRIPMHGCGRKKSPPTHI